jgi:Mannosyltransferase (PIG-V)
MRGPLSVSASLDVTSTSDQTEPAAPAAAASRGWLTALRYCAAVYLAVRAGLFVLGAAAWGLSGSAELTYQGGFTDLHNGWQNGITGWIKMDSGYFIEIAQHGYLNHYQSAAFFPGYPALIRAASYLCFGNMVVAGLIVSNAALLAALVVLYRLTEREYDEPAARRAVLYLCLFPTAFFFFTLYTESVFLLAAVGALALARYRHWAWASLAGLAAGLTRSAGIVIAIALAVEAIHQIVEDRRSSADSASWRTLAPSVLGRLVASAGPLAGVAGYLLFWQLRFHDGSYPLRLQQSVWGRQLNWPWATLWHGLTAAAWHGTRANLGWPTFDFVLVVVGLALGVWVAIRTRPVYAVYSCGSILFFLLQGMPGRPLAADPRYLVVIFPLVWALARLGKNPHVHTAVVALSSAGLTIASWLFLTTVKVF